MLNRQDIFIGATLIAAGISIVGLMVHPFVLPGQIVERSASAPSAARAAFDQRWPPLPAPAQPEPPPALQHADRQPLPMVAAAEPVSPLAALRRPARPVPSEPKADEPRARELCARHGMQRHYFHSHHGRHLSWRCVGRE